MRNADKSGLLEYALRLYAPKLLEHSGLQREYRFAPPRRWRFDWAWIRTARPLAVEIDGGRFAPGGGYHAGDSDREKLNAAAILGWVVLRFSTQQLDKYPRECVEQIVNVMDGVQLLTPWLKGEK
jgi:very-short-patch-repair endonuclease